MSLSERITTETLRKIASNEEYEESEILCVAEYLFDLYEYDFGEQFGLLTASEPARSPDLGRLRGLDVRERPFFAVYTGSVRHWVCFAVTHLRNSVVVLYKDSLGAAIPHELRDAIGDCLNNEKVRFESHRGTEQGDGTSSGPICLRNLQVFLKGLKTDFIKVPLIDKFQKVRFCTQYGVQSVKREFRLWLQKYLISGLEEVAMDLVEDKNYQNFHADLRIFLESCSKLLKDTYLVSSNYTTILKTEAKKKDQDPRYETDHKMTKAIKEARENFNRNFEVQRSFKFNTDDFIDLDDGNRVYNLDIQEKYPEQMQKFTKIFAVLAQTEMSEELEKALLKVCEMLHLDYEEMKVFFGRHNPLSRMEMLQRANVLPNRNITTKTEIVSKPKSKVNKQSMKVEKKIDVVDKKIKSWNQLISELVLDVQGSKDELLTPEEAAAQRQRIADSLPLIQDHWTVWSERGAPEITMYANACRAEEKLFNEEEVCEAIAVLDRAHEIVTGGQRLRAPQILSVLVFLTSTASYHGKLCQIESGEGKTVIVSLLVTIMILQGEKAVDVITSSAVLAQEGIESRREFYSMFGISVATNAPEKVSMQGPRKCYLADVVYGSISDFQFDYLRDTAEGLGTMSGRQFGRVILDEVDNMLVDNGRHIAKISSPFPGMENLKYIYLRIWNELLVAESDLVYDFQEKLDGFADLQQSKDMAITEFVKIFDASMIGRMEERIKANLKDLDMRFVPSHCLRYATTMISKWVGNAIRARYFIHENEQYSIKEQAGELTVVPVDYSNTGVTLKNTVWSHGLHQFVQIKHNLRITPESLTSSCVSNYAYIGKYGNKIFGLTGTLGSRAEQDLLSSIYNIDYARVPTYKAKVFEELNGLVVADDQWATEVALLSVGMVRACGRAILVICKTIADLLALEEQLELLRGLPWTCEIRIKKFQDEETAGVTRETVRPGDIIVATNIAGRGADFKTSRDLERNGGLHVCVGFCPDNERVREQAFFRTSRQGNKGSAQLVIRESELRKLNLDAQSVDFDEVKRRIDIVERERLSDIKHTKVDVLRYEDALFTLFSDFCQELKNNNVITWGHSYLMKDLKEYWAFWLEDQNFEGKTFSLKEASFAFYKFKNDEKTRRIVAGNVSQNPFYGVLQADFFLKNDEVDKAKAALVNAICLSKNASVMYPAFLTLFDATLEEKGALGPRCRGFLAQVFAREPRTEEKPSAFAAEIREFLSITRAGLDDEIRYMESRYFDEEYNEDFKRVLLRPVNGGENSMVKHLAAKLTCLKVYRGNVEILLEALEGGDTGNLAVMKRMTDYLKHFTPDTKEDKQTRNLITEPELSELSSKGLRTIYSLKKLATVPSATLQKAKTQLLGAMTLVARSSAFPPLNFAVANIASLMVAEAMAQIVLALYKEDNDIDKLLRKSEYLKGKTLNYVVSILTSGTLNLQACNKIFLRMVRCYRESYYLLESSNEDIRLLKAINASQMTKTVQTVVEAAEPKHIPSIRVPQSLATYFFESDVAATVIGTLAEFVVDQKRNGHQNGNIIDHAVKKDSTKFYYAAKDSQSASLLEKYLTSISLPKLGGAIEEISPNFPSAEGLLRVSLLPGETLFKGTPYAMLPSSQMPGLVVLDRDYRALEKLRFGDKGPRAVERRQLLEKGEFSTVLKDEIADLLSISKYYQLNGQEYADYTAAILQMLQYCKDGKLVGAPKVAENVPKDRLINQQQYETILKQFNM